MNNYLEINVNERVIVELTPFGKQKILDHFNHLFQNHPLVDIKINECLDSHEFEYSKNLETGEKYNICYKITLWELMHYFGDEMYMGNNNVCFVDNKIKVEI